MVRDFLQFRFYFLVELLLVDHFFKLVQFGRDLGFFVLDFLEEGGHLERVDQLVDVLSQVLKTVSESGQGLVNDFELLRGVGECEVPGFFCFIQERTLDSSEERPGFFRVHFQQVDVRFNGIVVSDQSRWGEVLCRVLVPESWVDFWLSDLFLFIHCSSWNDKGKKNQRNYVH